MLVVARDGVVLGTLKSVLCDVVGGEGRSKLGVGPATPSPKWHMVISSK